MNFYRILLFVIVGACLNSCGNLSKNETKSMAPAPKKIVDIAVASLAVKSDPVCGMTLKQGEVADTALYQGKVYGFCGTGCKDEFVKAPSQYLTQ